MNSVIFNNTVSRKIFTSQGFELTLTNCKLLAQTLDPLTYCRRCYNYCDFTKLHEELSTVFDLDLDNDKVLLRLPILLVGLIYLP